MVSVAVPQDMITIHHETGIPLGVCGVPGETHCSFKTVLGSTRALGLDEGKREESTTHYPF
jgi:hypothetical protein